MKITIEVKEYRIDISMTKEEYEYFKISIADDEISIKSKLNSKSVSTKDLDEIPKCECEEVALYTDVEKDSVTSDDSTVVLPTDVVEKDSEISDDSTVVLPNDYVEKDSVISDDSTVVLPTDVVEKGSLTSDNSTVVLSDDELKRLISIAKNPSTPRNILVELAKHKQDLIKSLAAGNPNLPENVLDELSTDDDTYVRLSVAFNPSTPRNTLVELAMDNDYWVRTYAQKNLNAHSK